MKKCLNRVEKKNGEAASIGNCMIFNDKSIGDKRRRQNLVKKHFEGFGQSTKNQKNKKQKKNIGGGYKLDVAIYTYIHIYIYIYIYIYMLYYKYIYIYMCIEKMISRKVKQR